MTQPLDATDMAPLTPLQKAAIYEAMFMVIAIDRELTNPELKIFNTEIMRIPWGLDALVLDLIHDKAHWRVKSTLSRDGWRAWIKEIGLLLPNQHLREKLLFTMAQIALRVTGEPSQPVRGVLNEFAAVLQIAPPVLAAMRTELGR